MISVRSTFRLLAASAALSASFVGSSFAVPLVALTSSGQIARFDSATPQNTVATNVTGLAAGELLLAIDLRPSNNQIYGISNANRLYTVNPVTGASTFVAALSTPVYSNAAPSNIEIDFNPVADRGTGASLRVIAANGGNFAVNAATGAVTVATSIAAGNTAIAYSNSDPSQPSTAPANTQLYYLNSTDDKLFVATSAFNAPLLNLVGDLGLNVGTPSALEIFSNGVAYAAATTGGLASTLFTVNLSSGLLTSIGSFTGSIIGLTSDPANVPLPGTLALLLGGLGIVLARKK